MNETPQVLLHHHLEALKLPTFLREYEKMARQCASEGVDHVRYLTRLVELELIDRERRLVERRENVIAVGNAGTGKTHIALGLGLAACQKGLSVSFTTAAALVHELIEARDEKRLLRLQRQLAKVKLLIIPCPTGHA